MTGEMIAGRYRLGEPLGSGGMAEVFGAMDERLERPVAVKLLRAELAGDPGLRRRFEIEARAAARLVHPNVVGVFDTGELGERPYIVMERLPGATLADRLRDGRMDEPGVRRLASEVLGALAAAHAAGILHRDIKPSNILWARDGSAKVADFGIAKGMEPLLDTQTGDITATNLVIGTPAYLAPERLLGRPATPRSDLWSLGAVLYEALAGVRPYPSATALVHDPDMTEVVPLESRRPGVDSAFAGAIDRALARRPDQRFATAAAMAAAAGLSLAGLSAAETELATARLEGEPQGPTAVMEGRTALLGGDELAGAPVAPPGPPVETDQRARRLRALALLAVALIALAAIGIAFALRGGGGSTPSTTTTTPPTTGVTRPPTTRPPVTTTTAPPTTTTTAPTTTTSSSTTTSSTTSTTSGVLGPGGGRDHKIVNSVNGANGNGG